MTKQTEEHLAFLKFERARVDRMFAEADARLTRMSARTVPDHLLRPIRPRPRSVSLTVTVKIIPSPRKAIP